MRVEISLFVGALGIHLARGHGQMYNPTPWQAMSNCNSDGVDCHWDLSVPTNCPYWRGKCHADVGQTCISQSSCHGELSIGETAFSTNYTMIPLDMEPMKDEDMFDEWLDPDRRVTWVPQEDESLPWTKRYNPWNAPGSAFVYGNGCGVNGGNPVAIPAQSDLSRVPLDRRCTSGGEDVGQCCGKAMTDDCGGYSGGKSALEHYQDGLFGEPMVTTWTRGEAAEVYWTSNGYHRGGYAYRLCRVPQGQYWKVTEDCFQQGHLNFSEQTADPWTGKKTSWIYWHPWVADPELFEYGWIPMELKTTKTGTTPAGSEWAKVNLPKDLSTDDMWLFKDLVEVPETLEPGDYVLSFRWDCLESPQIWNACANIEIV